MMYWFGGWTRSWCLWSEQLMMTTSSTTIQLCFAWLAPAILHFNVWNLQKTANVIIDSFVAFFLDVAFTMANDCITQGQHNVMLLTNEFDTWFKFHLRMVVKREILFYRIYIVHGIWVVLIVPCCWPWTIFRNSSSIVCPSKYQALSWTDIRSLACIRTCSFLSWISCSEDARTVKCENR